MLDRSALRIPGLPSCITYLQPCSIDHFYILLLFAFQLFHHYLHRWKHYYQKILPHSQQVWIITMIKHFDESWTFCWRDSQLQHASSVFPKKTTQQYFQMCWNCVRQQMDFLHMLKVLHKRDFAAFNNTITLNRDSPRYTAPDKVLWNYCHSITNLSQGWQYQKMNEDWL